MAVPLTTHSKDGELLKYLEEALLVVRQNVPIVECTWIRTRRTEIEASLNISVCEPTPCSSRPTSV